MATCIRIYKNGEWRRSEWDGDDLRRWIEYNTTVRFGNAVIVNGFVHSKGYLTEEEIQERLAVINATPSYNIGGRKPLLFDS